MSPLPVGATRLGFLFRVVQREASHLRITDGQVFAKPMDEARAMALAEGVDDAERVESRVAAANP